MFSTKILSRNSVFKFSNKPSPEKKKVSKQAHWRAPHRRKKRTRKRSRVQRSGSRSVITCSFAPAFASCLSEEPSDRSKHHSAKNKRQFLAKSSITPIKMDGEELSEQETALYDRQIRVWGVDAQRRLSKSHILVSGMTGTVVEFCKNVVLAGVGSLTLVDDRLVSAEALAVNFLVPPDEDQFRGKSLAEVCCDSLRDFNPMVHVSVEKGDISNFDGEFFDKFDAVVVGGGSLTTKKVVNEKCRKRTKRVAFYTVDCRDSCGEIFVDLQNYTYVQKKLDDAIESHLQYPSFEGALAVPWRSLPRKVTKLFFAMRVIEKFEVDEGRSPGDTSFADLPSVLKLWKELCEGQALNETHIPVGILERLLVGTREHPPVCAIIGGILGQEVIKAISGKGNPLKNFFFYDAVDGKGIIEDISQPVAG